MTHHPNTPASIDEVDAGRWRRLVNASEMSFPVAAIADDPENDRTMLYGRQRLEQFIDSLDEVSDQYAASRTEQAAPSVASGAPLPKGALGTLSNVIATLREYGRFEDEEGDATDILDDLHEWLQALAAPGAAIAAREQQTFEEWAEERGRLNIRARWADGSFVSTNAQLALEVWNAALASRQESPAASAQEEWMPVTPEQHSEAFAAGDLMALAEEAGGARMAENVVQVTRSDIERIIYFAKNREDTAARSPATVAQPVAAGASRKSAKAAAEYEVREWMGENDVVLKSAAYRALITLVLAAQSAAQPCPSQGCGGDGGGDTRRLDWIIRQADEFSCTVIVDAPGDGDYRVYGTSNAYGQGKTAREAIDAAALSADKGDGGSKE